MHLHFYSYFIHKFKFYFLIHQTDTFLFCFWLICFGPPCWLRWFRIRQQCGKPGFDLGWEDSLEKGMATHSSILAWRIPWTEGPDRLQPMGSQRVRQSWATNSITFTFRYTTHTIYIYMCLALYLEKEMATHSSVFAWRIPGTGEPGGLSSLGSHRVGHDWSDLAAAAA